MCIGQLGQRLGGTPVPDLPSRGVPPGTWRRLPPGRTERRTMQQHERRPGRRRPHDSSESSPLLRRWITPNVVHGRRTRTRSGRTGLALSCPVRTVPRVPRCTCLCNGREPADRLWSTHSRLEMYFVPPVSRPLAAATPDVVPSPWIPSPPAPFLSLFCFPSAVPDRRGPWPPWQSWQKRRPRWDGFRSLRPAL